MIKRFGLVFQGILVVILLGWLTRSLDWAHVGRQCLAVSALSLGIVFCQRYTPYLLLGLRLHALFPQKVPFSLGLQASFLCVAYNNIFPARGGELVKIFWLRRKADMEYAILFSGVFLERLLDVSALGLLCLLFALPFLRFWHVAVLFSLSVCAWGGAIWLGRHPQQVHNWLAKWPLPLRFRTQLCTFLDFLGTQTHEKNILSLVALTFFMWSMNYLHVFLVINYLLHLQLTCFQIGLICVGVFFSSGLLLLPGGLGGMEALVFFLLEVCGVPKISAATAVLFLRVFYTLPPLLGALFILVTGKTGLVEELLHLRKKPCLPSNLPS